MASIRGKLVCFANVCSKEELLNQSEIGWINKDRFILTLNDHFYLMSLNQKNLVKCENGISYCRQQVDANFFAHIIHHNEELASNNKKSIMKRRSQKSNLEDTNDDKLKRGNPVKSVESI